MGLRQGRFLSKPLFLGATLTAITLGGVGGYSRLTSHTNIRDLQDARLGSRVRIAGVVTYIDHTGSRIWIQDETGAVPLRLAPAGLSAGQAITVSAIKTHSYDAGKGPVSAGLEQPRIVLGFPHIKLPVPARIAVNQFPTEDKNGILVQTTGVVRTALVDRQGLGQILIATNSFEVALTVQHPEGDYSKLVNAEVSAIGVPELVADAKPGEPQRRIWITAQSSVREEQPAPSEPLYSSRSIYLAESAKSGHRVRMRGHLALSAQGTINVEDQFGVTPTDIPKASDLPEGTPIEVSGFPTWDPRGVRIALMHAGIRSLPEAALERDSPTLNLPVFTTARSVRELSSERAARALPVELHGVVTYIDNIWTQMFVQDSTGGIYVKLAAPINVSAGDLVMIHGLTNPGNFAPVVVSPRVQLERRASLPQPLNLTPDIAASGAADSQFVELEGTVHPVKIGENPSHPIVTFELVSPLGRVHVYTSPAFSDLEHARKFEDASVRVRGVLGTVFNARRQLLGYQLLVQRPSDIQIIDASAQDPFSMEDTPIVDLLRYSPHRRHGHRVKVTGTVTFAAADHLYVQDSTGGVDIQANGESIKPGDVVEAVGYPTPVGRYSPTMTDAVVSPTGRTGAPQARPTTADGILENQYDSTLVSVEGRLRTAVYDPSRTTLVIQSGVRTFSARLDNADGGEELRKLPEGSFVRLTGICSMEVNPNHLYTVIEQDATTFHILLRTQRDVVIVGPAPFWTMRATLELLACFALLLPAVVVWVIVLRRRVRQQNAALAKAAETAQAMRDLSRSMQTVTRDKRFDTRVSVRGSADIARLVVGFNRMLAELQQHEADKLAAEAKLQHMAMIDELTSLPNRRMLFDRLAQSLARAERLGHKLALLYLDLDGFKTVNDSLGHSSGDLLLSQVARRLRTRARTSDTLARIGGDEFVLILEDVVSVEAVMAVARSFIGSLEPAFEIDEHCLRISASAGIAIYPEHGLDGESLLQYADCAMYAAKSNGKNQVVVFGNDLGNAARERLTLESELRKAIAEDALTVAYQPEFDLATGRLIRFEALARWNHPELGAVSPAQFIPIAEESGLIIALGSQIMTRACGDARRWRDEMGCAVQVAVNVSSVQFARDSFLDELAVILDETGLSPSLLQIELTESVNLTGFERSSAVLRALREMGVSVAIDDFGTGYSCLSYLPRLPFDAVKIDRSFVNERMADSESVAFLKSIIEMAHNLRMCVIVEGIETLHELRAFAELGADQAQGNLLGCPTHRPEAVFQSAPDVIGMLAGTTQSTDLQGVLFDSAALDG